MRGNLHRPAIPFVPAELVNWEVRGPPQSGGMDAHRLGTSIRAIRIRRGWRQEDLAREGRVTPADVSRLERGHADRMAPAKIRAIATALDAKFDYSLQWRGGDLDRLLNSRHAAMHELVAWILAHFGWERAPEVSFSIWGERGVVDILAWHEPT